MSLHAGQEQKLLQGQIIIRKVTLERAQGVMHVHPPYDFKQKKVHLTGD